MKYKLLASLSAVGLAIAFNAHAQQFLWQNPLAEYIIAGTAGDQTGNGQIDALNFLNPEGYAFVFEDPSGTRLFNTFYTTNYVNRGTIICIPGVDFSAINPTNGFFDTNSGSFANIGVGAAGGLLEVHSLFTISTAVGAGTVINSSAGLPIGTGKILVSASEITNSGTITGDNFSLVRFVGKDADLSQGIIDLNEGNITFAGTNVLLAGIASGFLDEYWGLAQGNTNTMVPAALLPIGGIAQTPPLATQITATNRNYQVLPEPIIETSPTTFGATFELAPFDGSNFLNQAVILSEPDPAFTMTVSFDPFLGIFVQWQWNATNVATGEVNPNNFLTLNDDFGEITNLQVVANGIAGPNTTYIPFNYTFSSAQAPSLFTPGPSTPFLPAILVTNHATSYEAFFTPQPQLTTDVVFGNVTNLPGRVEIDCANVRMSNSIISVPNYTLLKATNHFLDGPGIAISSPNLDLFLRRTNGSFIVTNLVAPYINHLFGPVQLWSARWTNTLAGITNRFHVLFVKSSMSSVSLPTVQNLSLTVTNFGIPNSPGDLVISDILNVGSNTVLNARSLTITTNAPGLASSSGQLNLLNFNGLFPDSTPNLQFLTNYGLITAANSIDFAGLPFDPTSPDSPPAYAAFVNHGGVIDLGSSIFAKYFEDGGLLEATFGSVNLSSGVVGFLTNGTVLATLGGISLACDSLLISNSLFQADGSITLSNSNILEDGIPNIATLPLTNQLTATVSNGNVWNCSGGLVLRAKPVVGDLLGTTITCTAGTNRSVPISWAAEDRGVGSYSGANNNVGFYNDAAVGHLILDGLSASSKFAFSGPGVANAIYIDELEFRDATTNTDHIGDYPGVQIASNMKVYYAQAIANGISIAEKLNGHNNGRFIWVSNYNYGYFSSTTIPYPDGSTIRVNTALVQSPDIDSDGDNVANLFDTSPFGLPNPSIPCPSSDPSHARWNPSGSDAPTLPDQPFFVSDFLNLGVVHTNQVFSDTLTRFGFDLPNNSGLTFSFSGSAPGWLTLAANGTLSGTPTVADVGTTKFPVRVTSTSGLSALATASITVSTNSLGDPVNLDPPAASLAFPAVSDNTANTAAGSYYGLVSDTSNGVSVDSSGFTTITVTPRGNFTAKVSIAGRSYSASGSLASGSATKTLSSPTGASLRLTLQQSGPDQIHGSLSNSISHWSAKLLADRWSKNPDNVGGYTIILPPDTNSPTGPGGYGNGFVNVAASGRLHWAGTLADGSKVTQSSGVSKDGYWPLYSSLYNAKGLILGWVLFTNDPAPDLSADLGWIKPRGTALKAFSGNFTNSVPAFGSSYKTVRGSALRMTQGSLVLTGGPLGTNSITNSFAIDAHNHLKSASKNLRLSVKPGTGLLSGTVFVPGGSRLSFQAALLQDSTNAFGFFLNSGLSGSVNLSPAQ
jgi:hypothetical protein